MRIPKKNVDELNRINFGNEPNPPNRSNITKETVSMLRESNSNCCCLSKWKKLYSKAVKHYSEKRGILHSEILLLTHAPSEYADENTLWNAVEKIEKQWNSQLA